MTKLERLHNEWLDANAAYTTAYEFAVDDTSNWSKAAAARVASKLDNTTYTKWRAELKRVEG